MLMIDNIVADNAMAVERAIQQQQHNELMEAITAIAGKAIATPSRTATASGEDTEVQQTTTASPKADSTEKTTNRTTVIDSSVWLRFAYNRDKGNRDISRPIDNLNDTAYWNKLLLEYEKSMAA